MLSRLPSEFPVGIIGSGQLGLMMVLESAGLGIEFNVLGNVNDKVCRYARCFDNSRYEDFIEESSVVTYEFEQGNEEAMLLASRKNKLIPDYRNVWMKIERDREKEYLKNNNFPVPRFVTAENGKEAIREIRDQFNWKAVVKKVRGGYDGKGQFYVLNDKYDPRIEKIEEKVVIEEYVDFDYESSIIIVRGNNEISAYPVTLNVNKEGILLYNYGPIKDSGETDIGMKLATSMNYIGVIGIEFFVKDGKAIINEFSPRVHNSGHYTINSSATSQFENHIRAIAGLPLGSTKTYGYFGMVNILGMTYIDSDLASYGNVFLYGKENSSPRRKVGHINVQGSSINDVRGKIETLLQRIYRNDFSKLKIR
ncbi:MAG: 5-(carboxyamino)imidazole ribonucleotide synthase [Thermoplasmatales archaeon]